MGIGVGLPMCVCSRCCRRMGHHKPLVAMWQLDATGKCSGRTEDDDVREQEGACAHHQPRNLEIIIGEVGAKINRAVIYRKLFQRSAFC